VTPAAIEATQFNARLTDRDLRELVDRLPAGLIVVDGRLVVRYANLAAQRLVHDQGLKLRVGATLPDLGSGALRETASSAFSRGLLSEIELTLDDGRVIDVNGSMHDHLLTLSLEREPGAISRARAGQDFIINTAHEFLTPLTGIAGAAHVLQDGAKDDPETRDRFLEHIADGADRLIRISRGLLVLARAEAGLDPPRPEIVPLGPILAETLEMAGFPETGAAIEDGGHASVFADRDLLDIALGTLVQNARRYSTDGTVTVDVGKAGGARVVIEIGNPDQNRSEELLELKPRFVRRGGRDAEGYGVGLSIAERAIRVMDGKLSLRAAEGLTVARIELPGGAA
jgi:signal transduction histidine kinase